jgi:serine/threonine protein kinase
VKKRDTQRLYAMKVLSKEMLVQSRAVANTLTEKELLKRFDHPNIVSLKYCFQTTTHLYMVMDYISGGELFYHLGELGNFSESRARFYASQIILAIGFLHEHGIIYRDLKPENLLLDMNGDICLCDFGLAKEIYQTNDVTHTFCGSLEYMAPEVLKGEGYGRAVDWWSLGTIIYELLTGLPPFYSENPVHMQDKILHEPLVMPDHLSPAAKDLLAKLLHRDPRVRLGAGPTDAAEIRGHPFFSNTDWHNMLLKRVEPPFKPHLLDEEDTRYFDPECTTANPTIATAEIFSPTVTLTQQEQQAFDGFSYTSPLEMMKSSCEMLPPITPANEEDPLNDDFMEDDDLDDDAPMEILPSYYISPIPQMERPKPRKTTSLAQIFSPSSKASITVTNSQPPPSLVSSKSTPNLTIDMVSTEELPPSDESPKPKKVTAIKSFFKRKNSQKQKHK